MRKASSKNVTQLGIEFLEAFKESKVSGALAASIFHSGDASIRELKVFLKNKNLEIRL